MQEALKVWQIRYCNSEKHTSCERYQRSQQGLDVPLGLLPNGRSLNRGK